MTAAAPVRRRADAQQNRERILDAADIVFQRDGVNAPLDTITAVARVGKTTFFRHFPDRQSLLASLLGRSMDELEDEAERVADRPDGLFRLIDLMAERIGLRAAFVEYWNAADPCHPAVRDAFARTGTIFSGAVAVARASGLCRPDLTVEDIGIIGRMLAAAVQGTAAAERSAAAKRGAQILLEGLRGQSPVAGHGLTARNSEEQDDDERA